MVSTDLGDKEVNDSAVLGEGGDREGVLQSIEGEFNTPFPSALPRIEESMDSRDIMYFTGNHHNYRLHNLDVSPACPSFICTATLPVGVFSTPFSFTPFMEGWEGFIHAEDRNINDGWVGSLDHNYLYSLQHCLFYQNYLPLPNLS